MELIVVSPEGILLTETAERITLPGDEGPFSVLKNHAPLISTLHEGDVIYVQDKKTKKYEIKGGIAIVEKNQVRVFIE
ncbi:MAG: hypothetical protein PHG27_04240 [Massilibacteroides sp.]|nr:hypothetical protein [Massilibacteroides sp.]MDD3063660.1 hypothetical protein [Massilibacteroides sp.]MDD4114794.1 hypothetical protein [Massilibacteroides sp.]MDD4661199.1 hypothetical protein [Massilibacteroides sp.]